MCTDLAAFRIRLLAFLFSLRLGVVIFVVIAGLLFFFFGLCILLSDLLRCRRCTLMLIVPKVTHKFSQNGHRDFLKLLRACHLQDRHQRVLLLLRVRVSDLYFLLGRNLLFKKYFERRQHPSFRERLVKFFNLFSKLSVGHLCQALLEPLLELLRALR